MADETDTRPLIDWVAVAVSPVLVMGMVGSLVFFLIEVLYQGQYSDRLLYTMFFFVVGAVLIARITIEQGRARAGVYAAGLGGACFFAMMAFVEYTGAMKVIGPVINLMLMALVWWSSNKLTWDCTHFDDARKASGRGILGAAGLDESTPDDDEDDVKKKPNDELSWMERWEAYRATQRKKPHTPGVWVLYFALAALPLFALGQSLIPSDDSARRSATFYQMAMYVGSALGLLVTTSLMGLSRYLQDRGARIPPILTMGWLGLGAGLILLFLVVGAILPRPHSETPLVDLGLKSQGDRKASKNAIVKDGSTGKGEGAAGTKTEPGQGKNSAKGGEQKSGSSGEKGIGGGKGKSEGGKQKDGEKSGDKGDQKGNSNDKSDKSKSKSETKDNKGPNSKDDKQGDKSGSKQESEEAKQSEQSEKQQDSDKQDEGSKDDNSSSSSSLTAALEAISGFIKWIVWIVVAIAVVVGVIYFLLKGLSPFTAWAKNLLDWLRGLFGPKKPKSRQQAAEDVQAEKVLKRPPPFEDYTNPFVGGASRRRTPAELVEYTFNAFDSWAWDRNLGREPHETPTEFAVRIGHEYAELDDPGFATAELYLRVVYSRNPVPKDAIKPLVELWKQMESAK